MYSVDMNDVSIVMAETGSGKSTQMPQYLIQGGYTIGGKLIGIVVPRRIAAITLCKRVNE